MALDLFDRLRLREPFARAFEALGFEGEEAWRVAARVKVVLLTGAGVGQEAEEQTTPVEGERVALSSALWLDPDLRWLTGVHEAEGHEYFVREPYEELLWWLLMPSLLRLAGESDPGLLKEQRAAARLMSQNIDAALATAEAAGYRVDLLLGSAEDTANETVVESEADCIEAVSEPEAADALKQVVETLDGEPVLTQGTALNVPQEPPIQSQSFTPEEYEPSPAEEAEPFEPDHSGSTGSML